MTVECLQIEPTTRCNFTCGFCCGRAMSQTDLEVATFERVLAAYPDIRHIELQGEGEPLMHPRFFDMLAMAHARAIRVSFVTNGSWLGEEAVDRLLGGGVEKIVVSLESADSKTFRAIRGGKLEKVIAGVERLMTERRRRGLDRPLVGFSVTMLKSTAGHLAGILELYRRLGLDGGLTTQPLQKMEAYAAVYDEKMKGELLDSDETDSRLLRFHRRVRGLHKEPWSTGGFYSQLMADWRPASRRCPWLERGLYVNREGTVTPCCMIKGEKHALGRVGDAPEKIMAARGAMREELAAGKTPAPCEGCEIARYAIMGRLELMGRVARVGLRSLRHLTVVE